MVEPEKKIISICSNKGYIYLDDKLPPIIHDRISKPNRYLQKTIKLGLADEKVAKYRRQKPYTPNPNKAELIGLILKNIDFELFTLEDCLYMVNTLPMIVGYFKVKDLKLPEIEEEVLILLDELLFKWAKNRIDLSDGITRCKKCRLYLPTNYYRNRYNCEVKCYCDMEHYLFERSEGTKYRYKKRVFDHYQQQHLRHKNNQRKMVTLITIMAKIYHNS